ncbi:MAG TPA: hypothetical protein VK162_25770 [Streptosporangiaceae bacterium]|nr:hypothetical protein [Streptosporangiaceae bacterium]
MHAITVSEYGGSPSFTELPKPQPGPGPSCRRRLPGSAWTKSLIS